MVLNEQEAINYFAEYNSDLIYCVSSYNYLFLFHWQYGTLLISHIIRYILSIDECWKKHFNI